MNILSWIVVGLIAGWLAGMVMKGGGYGVLGDIIVGIVGALIGGFIASRLFGVAGAVSGINLTSIVVAFLGAVIAIGIVRAISPGRTGV
ncbi:MAG: GlsB/YeaQ/YmgE family stress response membrane protein [Chloroflexota bacterium]